MYFWKSKRWPEDVRHCSTSFAPGLSQLRHHPKKAKKESVVIVSLLLNRDGCDICL